MAKISIKYDKKNIKCIWVLTNTKKYAKMCSYDKEVIREH